MKSALVKLPKLQVSLSALLIVVAIAGILLAISATAYQRYEITLKRDNRLRQIAVALWAYADDHQGQWPPTVTYDENGAPMHSWRALLIPYLELDPRFEKYDFSQPWDSPHNLKIGANCPDVFRSPFLNSPVHSSTTFRIVGPDTANSRTKIRQFETSVCPFSTMTWIANANQPNHWLEPIDLPAELLTTKEKKCFGYRSTMHVLHAVPENVEDAFLMVDGSVQRLASQDDAHPMIISWKEPPPYISFGEP